MVIAHMNRRRIRPKGGKREDLDGLFLRSAMEANVARIFEALRQRTVVTAWWYEPHVYTFARYGYSRGPWAYTPDFLVQWNQIALENDLAGWANILPGKRPAKDMPLPIGHGYMVKGKRPCIHQPIPPGHVIPGVHEGPKARIAKVEKETNYIRGEYFEVKGREMPSDRSKAKRMAKCFPEVRVTQIGIHDYTGLAVFWSKLIPTWEGRR